MAMLPRGTGTRINTASHAFVVTQFDGVADGSVDSGYLGYGSLETHAQPMLISEANMQRIPLCWGRGSLPLNMWPLSAWVPSSLPAVDAEQHHIVINNGSFGGFDYEYWYWDAGGWGVRGRLLREPKLLRIGPAYFSSGANCAQEANMKSFLSSLFTSRLKAAGVSILYSPDQIYAPSHNGYNTQLLQAVPLESANAYADDTRIFNPYRHEPVMRLNNFPLDPGEYGDCNFYRVGQPQWYSGVAYAATKYEGGQYLAIAEDLQRRWCFILQQENITDEFGGILGVGLKSIPLIDSTGIAAAAAIKARFRKYRVVQVYGKVEATEDVFTGPSKPALITEAQTLQVPAEHAGLAALGWTFHETPTAITFAAWTAMIEAQAIDFFDL